MSRLTKVTGEFMGVRFEVKPTPIVLEPIEEKRKSMLMEWYKEHHPELHAKLTDDSISMDDFDFDDLSVMNAWKADVEFRSGFCKFMADSCMKFSKEIPDAVWQSDELELGTIEEAWDFFTGRRRVPLNGL